MAKQPRDIAASVRQRLLNLAREEGQVFDVVLVAFAADILPTLAERTSQTRADPIRTWAYFTKAIAKRHAQRLALAVRAKSAGETKTVPTLAAHEILLQTAEWLNSGRFVPPSAVNNTTRDALLRAGLVTKAILRSHQIY